MPTHPQLRLALFFVQPLQAFCIFLPFDLQSPSTGATHLGDASHLPVHATPNIAAGQRGETVLSSLCASCLSVRGRNTSPGLFDAPRHYTRSAATTAHANAPVIGITSCSNVMLPFCIMLILNAIGITNT